MKKISMKTRGSSKTFDEGFEQFIIEYIKFFVSKGWIDSSIKVNLIKADIESIEAYTDEEIEVLLRKPNMKKSTFAEYSNWVIVNFLCNTGCRRTTLINICLMIVNSYFLMFLENS